MKRFLKLGLCLFLCAVELFCMFIPALAAETGQVEKTLGFNESSIYQDLLGKEPENDTEKAAFDEELKTKYPAGSAPTLISFAARGTATSKLYFWFRWHTAVSRLAGGWQFTLKDPNGESKQWTAQRLDTAAGAFIKFSVDVDNRYLYGDEVRFVFCNMQFKRRVLRSSTSADTSDYSTTDGTLTYNAMSKTVDGGEVAGEFKIIYNVKDKYLASATLDETLSLDVKMACERFSTSEKNVYKQVNTAMFLIPNEYFERYKDLIGADYRYDRYIGVPMLITTDAGLYNTIHSKQGMLDIVRKEFVKIIDGVGISPPTYIPVKVTHKVSPAFTFFVDEISDEHEDVSTNTLLERFHGISNPTEENVGGKLEKDQYKTLHAEDKIITDSYKNATDGFFGFFKRVADGTLGKYNIDDSINIDSISVVEPSSEITAATDKYISGSYYIDPTYADDFKALNKDALSSGAKIVLLRYLVTDYSTEEFGGANPTFSYNDKTIENGYIAFNDIIANFQIIKLYFGDRAWKLDDPRVVTVKVDMEPTDFIGGAESPDKGANDLTEKPSLPTWLSILFKVVAGVVIFIVVVQVIKLIGYIRTAFGKRHHKDE